MNELASVQNLLMKLANVRLTEQDIRLWQATDHQSNHTYRIHVDNHEWIAKVFLKPEEFEDAPNREFAAMQLLAPYDIAPKPIHFEKHTATQNPIVIYEFMEGEMWNRSIPTKRELQNLAQLWLTMNHVSVNNAWLSRGMERTGSQIAEQFISSFRYYADWTEANFPEGRKTAIRLKKLAEQRIELVHHLLEMKMPLCFSRADPRFANVIRRPQQQLGMIDWEDSGMRDAARDIADLMSHPNQEDLLSWEDWQAFLEPFLAEHVKRDTEIEKRIHYYNAAFPLFWLSGLIIHGIRRWEKTGVKDWTINEMNANERLRRYLARVMAWPEMDFEHELAELSEFEFFDIG